MTLVPCNAKCVFCPSPTSAPQRQEFGDKIFARIIEDLPEIPVNRPCSINLHRINEPSRDPRMERFIRPARDKIPGPSRSCTRSRTVGSRNRLRRARGVRRFAASRSGIYRRGRALRRDLPPRRTVPGCRGRFHLC
uniref:Uncharacterized protein n=1 Tax=Rubrivivax gelatinosus S1 TaxID=1138313 RepID=L8BA40_RUBGE|nr:hypothetical protein RGS1_70349 [Rubrivivax gelatinosus S1]